jgi:hypothetical protein
VTLNRSQKLCQVYDGAARLSAQSRHTTEAFERSSILQATKKDLTTREPVNSTTTRTSKLYPGGKGGEEDEEMMVV